MARYTRDANESKHITDTLIESLRAFNKISSFYLNNGQIIKGQAIKNGSELSPDLTGHHGWIHVQLADGSVVELDVLDVQGIK